MAKANFWQRGETIDYVNTGSDLIEAGTLVVIGKRLGVAGCDIEAGKLGSVHVEGVFAIPKGSAAINQGAEVTFGGSVAAAAGSGDDVHGYAVQAAAADDTTVLVKINA